MRVIATAGHVDHGKSTLVRALSGIEPDRLREEQERGLTIDLGFAWIELPIAGDEEADSPSQGEQETVGIVDVPGHIDFIKNMLAGVGSVDAAVLVIAADEGVMPQTREHLAILDLLAVPTGLVALTKTDLIDDPEWLELVELDIVELLEPTRLSGAPIVPLSAVSGAGLDRLRSELSQLLRILPPRRDRRRPRLPIDRIFTLAGFGTIVTGTLSDGSFSVGDAIDVLPDGPSGRIRGIQSHNRSLERALPGSRVALNLSGISTEELSRGQVVVHPQTLRSTRLLDASFQLLKDAARPLTHNLAVEFFSGATETPAHVRLLGVDRLQPGEDGWIQVRLERPVLVAAGDRFILRQPSPSVTLGGGEVLNPHPRRRYRRFDERVIERLRTLAAGRPDEILFQTLERQPLLGRSELIGASGLGVESAEEGLNELESAGAIVSLGGGRALLTLSAFSLLQADLLRVLATYHARHPLRKGMPRGELRSQLQIRGAGEGALPVTLFNEVTGLFVDESLIDSDGERIWLAGHRVEYSPTQQAAVEKTLKAFADSPFSPPNRTETLSMLNQDETLFESLIERSELIRLPGDVLYRPQDLEQMIARVQEVMAGGKSITLGEARDLFGTSRKYVQALLEEMDSRRITRRDGDQRVLRSS